MKLWLAELILSVSEEYGISPTSCGSSPVGESAIQWPAGPDRLAAACYPYFNLLRKWNKDPSDYGYVQYLFYSDGRIGQITTVSAGWVNEEWFDHAGNPITYEQFVSIYF